MSASHTRTRRRGLRNDVAEGRHTLVLPRLDRDLHQASGVIHEREQVLVDLVHQALRYPELVGLQAVEQVDSVEGDQFAGLLVGELHPLNLGDSPSDFESHSTPLVVVVTARTAAVLRTVAATKRKFNGSGTNRRKGRKPTEARPIREDREPYASPVVDTHPCGFCGELVPQRATGRPRQYCDTTCRTAAHRQSTNSGRKQPPAADPEKLFTYYPGASPG